MGGFWEDYGRIGEKHPRANRLIISVLYANWEDLPDFAHLLALGKYDIHIHYYEVINSLFFQNIRNDR